MPPPETGAALGAECRYRPANPPMCADRDESRTRDRDRRDTA